MAEATTRLRPVPTPTSGRPCSVLHVSQPGSEGVARYVRQIAALQAGSGHRVAVACPPGTWLAQSVAGAGLETLSWPSARNPDHTLLRELRTLGAIVHGFDPDVIHLHSAKAGLAGRLIIRGRRPTVFQPHAWSFEALPTRRARPAVLWERLAGSWSDVIVAVSENERRTGAEFSIRAGIATVVVPNPVDTDRFRPEVGHPSETTRVRRSLGLGDGPVVLCVGRLCRQKGQDRLVTAWPAILRQVPDAHLVLVGDGPDREQLERRAGARVTFAGNRVDVPALLRAAQVVVSPSRWEGMSLAVLEAMATARPVVAADVAGVAETIGRGGGVVVPQGRDRAMAMEIVRRLMEPTLAGGEGAAGRRIVLDNHQIATAVDALGSAYDLAVQAGEVRSGATGLSCGVRVDG